MEVEPRMVRMTRIRSQITYRLRIPTTPLLLQIPIFFQFLELLKVLFQTRRKCALGFAFLQCVQSFSHRGALVTVLGVFLVLLLDRQELHLVILKKALISAKSKARK